MVYLDAIRADGPRLFTGSPPAQPTSRSGRGMDGIKHVLGIWAPGPRREPPSGRTSAPSWPTGASRTC